MNSNARPASVGRSVHDFHNFRVTWITPALAAGVPLELAQRVTGQRTAEVVMKHHFRPCRGDFRQAIPKARLGHGPHLAGRYQSTRR